MHFIKHLLIGFVLLYQYNSAAQSNDFNPYDVLGLSRSATDKDIRQAYKKLARHWHPDKNHEANAHDQFTKINAAYEVRSNRREDRRNEPCLLDPFRFDQTAEL